MRVRQEGSLVEPMVAQATRAPEREAIIFVAEDGSETRITAGELHAGALACAQGLRERGVRAGDVVIIVLGHSRALLETFLGALYAHGIPSIYASATDRLDAATHAERIRAVLKTADARALVTTPGLADGLPPLLGKARATVIDAAELPSAGGSELCFPPADATAFIQFTSGTTRLPRGIEHTHRRVLAYLAARAENNEFEHDDVIVSWLPLYHDLGLLSGLITPLVIGIPTVLMSPMHWVRKPVILLRAVHAHRGTHSWMPNFALNHCVRLIQDRDLAGLDLSSWRSLVLGGEPVRLGSIRAFAERFGPYGLRDNVFNAGYGMAENIEGGAATPLGRPIRVDWVRLHELGAERRAVPTAPDGTGALGLVSCGPPLGGTELRIVDERGDTLPERRVGQILLRSTYLMTGYYRQPALTAEVLRDGWMYSGDLGYLADGELFVCGRAKDIIIVGGRNVYPQDLEYVADGIPGLRPGRSVAFGIDDERLGSEQIVMVCEAAAEIDEGERARIQRELRRRTRQDVDVVLGKVHIAPSGWIIKTSSGKVARAANRDKYLSELGAAGAGVESGLG